MEVTFHTLKTADNKTQFIMGELSITVSQFTYYEGRHEIIDPQSAIAQFSSKGQLHTFKNTEGYLTVEDWYAHELYPKLMQGLEEDTIAA